MYLVMRPSFYINNKRGVPVDRFTIYYLNSVILLIWQNNVIDLGSMYASVILAVNLPRVNHTVFFSFNFSSQCARCSCLFYSF